ncbi:hypothetical protein Taro_050878, partial [Colocasia esculenta]|nr:hypothetical protein [Colocasia esculenta]
RGIHPSHSGRERESGVWNFLFFLAPPSPPSPPPTPGFPVSTSPLNLAAGWWPAAMVSDQEIASCVQSLLRQLGPGGAPVNFNGVVQQLEAKLGLDLSHKAGFIRDQINLLLRPAPAVLHQQQQQQHHLQPQFLVAHPHQLLQHQQIPPSPFTHLPSHHELAFQCAPPVGVQGHQLQQHQQTHPQQRTPAAGVGVVKQEGHLVPGSAVTSVTKESYLLISDVCTLTVAYAFYSWNSCLGVATGSKRRGGPGGLSKLCGVSPELQAIVGEPAMPRTQIVKQLWAYIRKNNLQDPSNKRKIICNDELRLVFETDSTDMFQMNKLLAKHIIPLEPTKDSGPVKKKLKATKVTSATETDNSQTHVLISDELAKFFGSGQREMLQSEALKRVWEYIEMYQLKVITKLIPSYLSFLIASSSFLGSGTGGSCGFKEPPLMPTNMKSMWLSYIRRDSDEAMNRLLQVCRPAA